MVKTSQLIVQTVFNKSKERNMSKYVYDSAQIESWGLFAVQLKMWSGNSFQAALILKCKQEAFPMFYKYMKQKTPSK